MWAYRELVSVVFRPHFRSAESSVSLILSVGGQVQSLPVIYVLTMLQYSSVVSSMLYYAYSCRHQVMQMAVLAINGLLAAGVCVVMCDVF